MTDAELIKKTRKYLQRTIQKDELIVKGAETVSSPLLTGMPKAGHAGNSSEDMMIRVTTAKREIENICDTIELLTTEDSGILQYRYLEHMSAEETARKYFVSRRQLNNLERQALLHFAYAFRAGMLLDDAVVA